MAAVRLLWPGGEAVNGAGLGIGVALIMLAVPVVVLVLVVRWVARRRGGQGGAAVRRFFQYLLLLGLLVVTVLGVTALVELALDGPVLVGAGGVLARGLTFTVVGGGLLGAVAAWTRAAHRNDPGERESAGWIVYLTFAVLIAAVASAVQLGRVVAGVVAGSAFDVAGLLTGLVWGVVWLVHQRLVGRTLTAEHALPAQAIGSLVGWTVSLVGLVGLVGGSLMLLVPDPGAVVRAAGALATPSGVLTTGAALWVVFWLTGLRHARTGPVWLGYVLLLGVGASLVMTLVGASLLLYRLLVWWVGDPGPLDTAAQLRGACTPLALALVGALSWWYHRQVLGERTTGERSEVRRVYEYLLSGIALLAAATGVALVVVAGLDVLVPQVLVTGSAVNPVVAAVTLLVVGGPLWWVFWRRIERVRAADPSVEVASPSRRVYLVLLFGVTGLVAVIVVLVATFVVVQDALGQTWGGATLHRVRVPIAVLIAAAAVSGYHGAVQRQDRTIVPAPAHRAVRRVLLVGPRADDLARQIELLGGARVEGWVADGPPWDVPAVLDALRGLDADRVLLLSGPHGLQVVPSPSPTVRPPAG